MSKTECIAVIQARMLSTRLRGKSLMAVSGIPLLKWVIQRVQKMDFFTKIVVATSVEAADDPIAAFAETCGVSVLRGDSEDVLQRFVDAASQLSETSVVARFTADNPLYDRTRSARLLERHQQANADYTHIDGLSKMVPELIRVACLRQMGRRAEQAWDREHVTTWIRRHAGEFDVNTESSDFEGLRPEYDNRFTIDRRDQLDEFESMISELRSGDPSSVMLDDCYRWLDTERNTGIGPIQPGQIRVRLAGREVGDGCPCFVIAEIGQNHNGQVNLAKKLIDLAARCSVDAVKFQKRDISWTLTEEAYDRPYTGPNSFGETYGRHREFLELNESQHRELKEYAQAIGLIYFCTPGDPPSVDILERIGTPFYKVASGDITNVPLLRHIALTGKPVIISTGMAGEMEIKQALEAFENSSCAVTLMQCVSQYPAEPKNINLLAIPAMRKQFGTLVALSDHNPGIITGVAGAAIGAFALEKHITLSRAMPGTDHAAALEESGLKRTVSYIRTVEEAMGTGKKEFNPVAQAAREKITHSLVSREPIFAGNVLTEHQLVLKSSGTGISWTDRDRILGKVAKNDIPAHVLLQESDFEQQE
ncbi:MAG: N-acetylneuraminate synthase family protein [Fuerstiella sp.]|nr:N-acetylneuraminate synthase family protein [Fuerstiella sp.]